MLVILNDTRLRSALAGGLGGFIGWMLVEPLVAPRLALVRDMAELYGLDAMFGALVGISVGLALGIAEGLMLRSVTRIWQGALIGGLAGLTGGAIGLVIGEFIYQPLKFCFFVGRSLGWAAFGVILGLAEGLTRRSWRGARHAALGGAVGGLVGGFFFDFVGLILIALSPGGLVSRMVALTILGVCIGFFITVLERALADGRLKVLSGRLEGREFLLDKPRLTVGSDERADIPLLGDPQIERQHAAIRQEGSGYVIEAVAGAPLQVNKQPTSRRLLQPEDMLLLGNTRLVYRSRKGTVSSSLPAEIEVAPVPSPSFTPPAQPAWPGSSPPAVPNPAMLPSALVNIRTSYRYPLQVGQVITLGRHPDNTVVLDGVAVSAFHAELRFENGRWVLYDQGSTNGVFVNDRRVAGANMLKPGFQVRLGDTTLRVE